MTISLEETIQKCLKNEELITQYKRLYGARLGGGAPIERMIDKATNYEQEEWRRFFDFVKHYIWLPLL